MNYTIKSVMIIGAVAVASFFVASAVIPERGAVAPVKRGAPSGLVPVAAQSVHGDIPVVVVGAAPAPNPIMASGAAPLSFKVPPEAPPPVARAIPAAPPAPPVAMVAPPTPASPLPSASRPALPPALVLLPVMPSAPPGAKLAPIEIKPAVATVATFTATPAPPAIAKANTVAAVAAPDTAKKKKLDPDKLGYKLAKAAVCSNVENRAPAGISDRFSKDAGAVYYFTHLVGATDSAAVLHRWYREGKLIQTSILQIKSPNWRTHSKRNLATVEEPAGNWKVEAVDMGTGKVLESASFVIE